MDFPANTKRLSERERELAIRRLVANDSRVETEDTPRLSHIQALKKAITNWRVWLFVIGYMAVVGSSTLSYFYPTLVAGLGYDTVHAQYSKSSTHQLFRCSPVLSTRRYRQKLCRAPTLCRMSTDIYYCSDYSHL